MILDDEYNILLLLKSMLEANGYSVLCYSDSELFMYDFTKSPPKFAIIDVLLPKTTGLILTEKIRSQPIYDKTHIIICSALSRDVDIEMAKRMGADAFLFKPFRENDLLSLFRKLTDD